MLVLLAPLLLIPAPALAADSTASFDWASASSRPGGWTASVHGGWPWSGLRAQVGLNQRLTLIGEVDTAVFVRFQPSAGLALLLVGKSKGRLSLEICAGGLIQGGVLAQQGPSASLRLRLAGRPAPVGPYLAVATRHTFLFHRTQTRQIGTEQADVTVRWEHRWSPSVQLGLTFAPKPHIGFDIGLDLNFVDVGVVALSLPGFHVGIHFGNPAPKARGS